MYLSNAFNVRAASASCVTPIISKFLLSIFGLDATFGEALEGSLITFFPAGLAAFFVFLAMALSAAPIQVSHVSSVGEISRSSDVRWWKQNSKRISTLNAPKTFYWLLLTDSVYFWRSGQDPVRLVSDSLDLAVYSCLFFW
jgi:heme exporter protein D